MILLGGFDKLFSLNIYIIMDLQKQDLETLARKRDINKKASQKYREKVKQAMAEKDKTYKILQRDYNILEKNYNDFVHEMKQQYENQKLELKNEMDKSRRLTLQVNKLEKELKKLKDEKKEEKKVDLPFIDLIKKSREEFIRVMEEDNKEEEDSWTTTYIEDTIDEMLTVERDYEKWRGEQLKKKGFRCELKESAFIQKILNFNWNLPEIEQVYELNKLCQEYAHRQKYLRERKKKAQEAEILEFPEHTIQPEPNNLRKRKIALLSI